MSKVHSIAGAHLSLEQLETISNQKYTLMLSPEAEERIQRCHDYLQQKLKDSPTSLYGVITGINSHNDTPLSEEELQLLQLNLLKSHACGTGEEVPADVVKLMLLLKIQALGYGHSGVQLKTVKRLIDFYNRDVYPIVYQLGGGGDKVQLAHLCLPLLGLGEVYFQDFKLDSKHVLEMFAWEPLTLQANEASALLNGTQFTTAYGTWCLLKARHLSVMADVTGALSLEAFNCRREPFNPKLHRLRPHTGQAETALNISQLLEGSEMQLQEKLLLQDPNSFSCIPQIHGATKDAITYVAATFTTEINAVTGSTIIFPDEDEIISGGNSHGQPLALALDFLAIALAGLGDISERRTYLLLSGSRGLPSDLATNPGHNASFRSSHATAASIVNQNKQLCTPAAVATIPSADGLEDHVSMGANAATKLYKIVQNVDRLLAIELMTAAQALEFRRPATTSPPLEKLITEFHKEVPLLAPDKELYQVLRQCLEFLKKYTV